MPVYEFLCDACGTRTPRHYLSWRDRDEEISCPCGAGTAPRVPSTFTVDFSTANYKKLLRDEGQIVWEPGLDRDIKANKKHREAKVRKEVERAVESAVTDAFTVNVSGA